MHVKVCHTREIHRIHSLTIIAQLMLVGLHSSPSPSIFSYCDQIFYKDERLRVVVPTANFMDYDWRDIENVSTYIANFLMQYRVSTTIYQSVWVQDIPIREDPIRHDAKATDFPGTLQRVLQALNVPAALKMHIDGKVSVTYVAESYWKANLPDDPAS